MGKYNVELLESALGSVIDYFRCEHYDVEVYSDASLRVVYVGDDNDEGLMPDIKVEAEEIEDRLVFIPEMQFPILKFRANAHFTDTIEYYLKRWHSVGTVITMLCDCQPLINDVINKE